MLNFILLFLRSKMLITTATASTEMVIQGIFRESAIIFSKCRSMSAPGHKQSFRLYHSKDRFERLADIRRA
jgi:hypothetical protein